MRLLWVVPRYGAGIVGGAEALVRRLAERAVPEGWHAEVATTCAVDHTTWRNASPEGTATEDGVTVHRFGVGPRDERRFDAAHRLVMAGTAGYADQLEWLSQSVTSPAMERFIEREASRFDLVILAPYLFGTTVWGAQAAAGRAALIPCLHDEPYARLTVVRAMLESVRGCLFNAPGEERLAGRLATVRDGGVVGSGFDPPAGPAGVFRPSGGEPYLLYAGRLEEGKRVDVLVEWVTRLRDEDRFAPRLLLIGNGGYRPPRSAAKAVEVVGYVSEEDKRAAYAGALALVNPSHMESLSLVLLEAWMEGTPAIVARGSEVMRDHVDASGGGFHVDGYEAFREAVTGLRDDPALATRMGVAGREYVLDVYGWTAVRRRFREVVERLAA